MKGIAIVFAVLLAALAAVPVPGAADETVEHEWWELGKDYVFTGNPDSYYGGYRYVRVNNSDVLAVNWKSGNVTTYPPYLYIYIYATQVINYSGLADPFNNFNKQMPTNYYGFYVGSSGSPPKSCWVRFGAPQVVKVEWYGAGAINVTLNVTVTPGEDALASKVAELEDRVAQLESALAGVSDNLASLSENLSYMEGSVADLRLYVVRTREMLEELNTTLLVIVAGLQDGQDGLRENLSVLQGSVQELSDELNRLEFCEAANYQAIQEQLAALNASLAEAFGELRTAMGLNDTALQLGLEEVQNRPVPEPYNDTTLREELARLEGNISMVCNTVVNNTTIQQPVTYVNHTLADGSDDSTFIGGAITGAVSGALIVGSGIALYDRQIRRRYGGLVQEP